MLNDPQYTETKKLVKITFYRYINLLQKQSTPYVKKLVFGGFKNPLRKNNHACFTPLPSIKMKNNQLEIIEKTVKKIVDFIRIYCVNSPTVILGPLRFDFNNLIEKAVITPLNTNIK